MTLLLLLVPSALASAADPSVIPWGSILLQAVNLALLLGVLVYFTRSPIKDALKNRSRRIGLHLDESNKMRREAQDRFDQLESRLSRIQGEIDTMRQESVAAAEGEAAHLKEETDADVARVLQAAEKAIRDEVASARRTLRQDAVEISIRLAEERLRSKVSKGDQDQLTGEFLGSVKGSSNGHG